MDYPKGTTKKLPGAKMGMKLPGSGEIKPATAKPKTGTHASQFADDAQRALVGK